MLDESVTAPRGKLALENEDKSTSELAEKKPPKQSDTYDLDKEKVRMVWDFKKTFLFTNLTIGVSAFVAIMVILNALVVSKTINSIEEALVVYLLTVFFLPYFVIKNVWFKNKELVLEVDALMEKLKSGKSIPSIKDLLKAKDPAPFWEEYKTLTGLSRKRIIIITVGLAVLIILPFFGL